jgi:hypothetical protein
MFDLIAPQTRSYQGALLDQNIIVIYLPWPIHSDLIAALRPLNFYFLISNFTFLKNASQN